MNASVGYRHLADIPRRERAMSAFGGKADVPRTSHLLGGIRSF